MDPTTASVMSDFLIVFAANAVCFALGAFYYRWVRGRAGAPRRL